MLIITNAGKLAKAIAKHGTTRTSIKQESHVLLLSCIHNAMISGNATLANSLLEVSDYAKKPMTKWAVDSNYFVHVAKSKDAPAHLAVKKATRAELVNDDGKSKPTFKDEEAFVKGLADLTAWYEVEKPQEYKPFVLVKELKALAARAKNRKDDEAKAGDKDDFTGLDKLMVLAEELATMRAVNSCLPDIE